MIINFWIVDVFGKNPFQGNPSAVFLIDSFDNEALLQNIAIEINTPETIFIKTLQNNSFESMFFSSNSKNMN
ncbi:MAG: PhzF family phenazine biosynthesis protein, partial [Holosporales bacterium]|nr:PhzF family phenazine biosynthesis protein [Holosporales bacterium]